MFKSVSILNSYGEKIKMVLDDPESSGYAITNISGLEPTEVDIKQTQLVSGLRYKYNFGFYKFREITFNIVYFEWNDYDTEALHTIEGLRDNLYKYLKTNDKVELIFERSVRNTGTGSQLFYINGYVSKHQAAIFSNQCGATVTVLCPDPWFKWCEWINDEETKLNFTVTKYSVNGLVNLNYQGGIFTGFKATTIHGVEGSAGKQIELKSYRETSHIFDINVPTNHTDSGVLGIDLSSDIVNVFIVQESGETEERYMVQSNDVTDVDRTYTLDPETEFSIGPFNAKIGEADQYFNENSELESFNKIIGLEDQTQKQISITNSTYFECDSFDNVPDHTRDVTIKVNTVEDDVILDDDENVIYGNYYGIYQQLRNVAIRFLKKPKYVNFNKNGWIDATSITRRQELPMIYPGENTISLISDSSNPIEFKIEYNTLYRGL